MFLAGLPTTSFFTNAFFYHGDEDGLALSEYCDSSKEKLGKHVQHYAIRHTKSNISFPSPQHDRWSEVKTNTEANISNSLCLKSSARITEIHKTHISESRKQ